MIEKITREIPLFESLGIFTEAPKKRKRKPEVISVRPIKTDYVDMMEPDEVYDVEDIDDTTEDLEDLGLGDLSEDISDYDDLPNEADDDYVDPEDIDDIGDVDSLDLDDISLDDIDMLDDESDGQNTGVEPEVIDATDGGEVPQETDITTPDTTEPAQTQVAPDTTEPAQTQVAPDTSEPVQQTTAEPTEPPVEGDGEVIDATGGDDGANVEDMGDLGGDVSLDTPPADGTDPNMQMDVNAEQQTQQSVTKDDVRKYELYKRFIELYNSIIYFIERLESGVTDNERFEMASNKAIAKFKRLETLTKDYMILKFQSDSFLQNSFFYEKIKANCLLIFKLLEMNKNKNEKS